MAKVKWAQKSKEAKISTILMFVIVLISTILIMVGSMTTINSDIYPNGFNVESIMNEQGIWVFGLNGDYREMSQAGITWSTFGNEWSLIKTYMAGFIILFISIPSILLSIVFGIRDWSRARKQ